MLTCPEPHQGLTLLKNSFSIPKLQYILRASPAYKCGDALHEFDELIRSTLSQITNVRINEKSWSQASLPFRFGGLGLRQAVDVSLLAFVCSLTGLFPPVFFSAGLFPTDFSALGLFPSDIFLTRYFPRWYLLRSFSLNKEINLGQQFERTGFLRVF